MGNQDTSDKEKLFRTEIGQRATVQRHEMTEDAASRPNRLLCDLGLELQQISHHLKSYRYFGSAAVHIYVNETMHQLDLISQCDPLILYRCPEDLASKAFDDLLRTLKQRYGHKVGSLRSGF